MIKIQQFKNIIKDKRVLLLLIPYLFIYIDILKANIGNLNARSSVSEYTAIFIYLLIPNFFLNSILLQIEFFESNHKPKMIESINSLVITIVLTAMYLLLMPDRFIFYKY